jgi:hypothetical protein
MKVQPSRPDESYALRVGEFSTAWVVQFSTGLNTPSRIEPAAYSFELLNALEKFFLNRDSHRGQPPSPQGIEKSVRASM